MLNPDFTPLTTGIEKWKKKKRKEKEWKERNFARLKYKNYYLNGRALLTADEILSVCGPRQRGRIREFSKNEALQGAKLHFTIFYPKKLGYFYWRRLSPDLIARW